MLIEFEGAGVPAEKLPKPSGWRILIAPVKIKETTAGGIVLVDDSIKALEYFRDVAKIVAMGEGCYEHPKFQGGIPLEQSQPRKWANVGDVIHYSSFTGKEISISHNGETHKFRYINDDEVVGVIEDLSIFSTH